MAQAIIAQMKKVDKIGTLFLNSNVPFLPTLPFVPSILPVPLLLWCHFHV